MEYMNPDILLWFCIPSIVVITALVCIGSYKYMEKKEQLDRSSHYRVLYGGRIEDLDTMDIPHSGFSAIQRRAEYMRRDQSPSGFINGIYNDQNRPRDVPYYDGNRDWGADD
jgi:hypothetical protein